MRRYLTSIFFLVSFVLAGCVQTGIVAPDDPAPVKEMTDLSLLVDDTDQITWSVGDELAVLSSADTKTCNRFVVSSKEGSTATLTGKIVKGSKMCAVYPFDESASMSVDGQMLLLASSMPAEQTEENLADVYVAVEKDGRLEFQPSSAKVRVTIKADGAAEEIVKVAVSGNNNENLSGAVQIMAFSQGTPVMMAPSAGEGTEAVLHGNWTVTSEKPLVVELGVAPGLLSGGYTISVTKADGVSSMKEYSTSVSLKSHATTALEEFVFEGPKYYFEYIADAKLDVAGYKNDYNAETRTGKIWLNTTDIPENILAENKDIKGVHIPAFITEVGAAAFQNCSNLTTLTFEEGSCLEVIRTTAFQKTALVRISFPASLKEVEVQGFQGVSTLRGISFPADSQLERLQQGAFNGSTQLEDPLVLPATVVFLDRCFNNKYNPKISPTILAVTPPELGNGGKGVFNVNGLNKIYVPKQSVDAYKNAWTTYKAYFAAIPE